MEKKLENVYFNPSHEASLSGATSFLREVRKKRITSADKAHDWLEAQDAYTRHRQTRRRFPRRFYNVSNIDDVWEADLVDLRAIKNYNDGYGYLLVVIDVLSKHAWVEPLHDKSALTTAKALTRILSEKRSGGRFPVCLQSDKGREFTGSAFQTLLVKKHIAFRVARNPDIKAAIVERFNRTLKERMWRYFTYSREKRYIDVLQDIVSSYNKTRHSSIKMAPIAVTYTTAARARANLLKRYSKSESERNPKYKAGDIVRISSAKAAFAKGYEGGWSSELFRIKRISQTATPPVYILCDLHDEEIDGIFYEPELSRVQQPKSAREKVAKRSQQQKKKKQK